MVRMAAAITDDSDADGYIDTVSVTFSTAMDSSSVPTKSIAGSPGIRVEGYEIDTMAWGSAPSTTLTIKLLEKSTPDTAARPVVYHVSGEGGAKASSGLEAESGQLQSTDGSGPVLLSFSARDRALPGLFNGNDDEARIKFSEPVTLHGAGAMARWSNLERAFFFESEGACNGADGSGIGSPTTQFPRPNAMATEGVTADPVEDPIAGAFADIVRVRQKAGTVSSSQTLFPTGEGCWVGIDPAPANAALIMDAAGLPARTQNEPTTKSRRVRITAAEVGLVGARTVDGRNGDADGTLDAIELRFEDGVQDATVQSELGSITVKNGTESSALEALDSGTPNDSVVYLRFSSAWDTGVTPRVSYAKPAGCAPASATGIKATVSGQTVCVSGFDVVATDAAGPILRSVRTVDGDADGLYESARATFSESISTGGIAGWTIDGASPTTFTPDGREAVLGVTESASAAPTPAVAYAQQGSGGTTDPAGNQLLAGVVTAADGAGPTIIGATVYDVDGDGSLDHARVEFTEAVVEPAAAAAGDFTVGGIKATAFERVAAVLDDPKDRFLTLAVHVPGTSAQALTYAPAGEGITDATGNRAGAKTLATDAVFDGAKPVGALVIGPHEPLSSGTSTVTASFSEAMKTDLPSASIAGKPIDSVVDNDHTNGWRNADPTTWDGSVSIVASECAASTGCPATVTVDGVKDTRDNPTASATSRSTEIDTTAPQAPTGEALQTTLEEGENAPANVFNMYTKAFKSTGTIVAGDAEGGSAELLLDGASFSPPISTSTIGATDTSVALAGAFATKEALQAAVAQGARALTIKLCDDALNCVTSSVGINVTADYTPVAVTVGAPNGGETWTQGSAQNITWSSSGGAADFDEVILSLSEDGGTSYPIAIASANAASGTHLWTVPDAATSQGRVRAVSVDINGNKAEDVSDGNFTIEGASSGGDTGTGGGTGGGDTGGGDTGGGTTPVDLQVSSPSSADPFLPAGGTTVIRWQAVGGELAVDPITIEWSNDDGSTWTPINGGAYSHANDGEESWRLPAGPSFTVLLRVGAQDSAGQSTSSTTSRLAKGVAGYFADRGGEILAWGSADPAVRESYRSSGDVIRGLAIRPLARYGYVVNSRGYVYPFAVGSARMPARPNSRGLGADMARGITLRGSTNGYVVDRYGRLTPWGGAPKVRTSKTWSGKDYARDVVMLASNKGGYVLDAFGRLHPFAVGNYAMPRSIQPKRLFGPANAVSLVLRSNQRSGWILARDGRLYAFGGAPSVASTGTGSSATAKSLVLVTDSAGYWADGNGTLHAWGGAFGNPSRTEFTSDRVRAMS